MISSTIFFWVLPVMFALFTAVFVALARSDSGSRAARNGAAAFGIGVLAIIIDTQRLYFPHNFFTFAVPLHWLSIVYMMNAFLCRHGERLPPRPTAIILTIGIVINLAATYVVDSVAIRVPNASIVAIALITLGLPRFLGHRSHLLDRLVALAMAGSWLCYLVRFAAYFMLDQSSEYARRSEWSQYMLTFYFTSGVLGLSLAFLLILTITKDMIERHHSASTIDALTGIANRRGFDRMVDQHQAGALAFGAVMMIDLDRFKQINDLYGHAAGDEVLAATARTLAQACQVFGEVARLGGEEFAVLVRATHASGAMQLAELLRTSIASTRCDAPNDAIRFTTSIGVAEIEPGESVGEAMRRADLALYRAKESGRNRIVHARASLPPVRAVA